MDETQKRTLLELARDTIRTHLAKKPLPDLPEIATEPADFGGAFVTLRNAGRLRGCIGQFESSSSLAKTVQQMAVSALGDPRFRDHPITADEVPRIDIEISVLSRMKRTDDPLSLQVGVHGIYIRKDFQSGCFLPQVAAEQGWSKEQFLSRCCSAKAGLSPDAWKEADTEVYLFSAEVIAERQ